MDKHDKILAGMEKMAASEGHALAIEIAKDQAGNAIIVFTAGKAQVYCRFSSFCRAPQIVVEPFGEQLIKAMKGQV